MGETIYNFYAKKDYDYKLLGFEEDKKEFVLWKKTRRITIKKLDNYKMSFNMVDKQTLAFIINMDRKGLIEIKAEEKAEPRVHNVALSDTEFKMIMERRKQNGE